ncbi:MAG: hypothetical protein K0U66_05325 [Gammaproteobacteria bacterium]|nr:hypothetical protein [Gammaproteobacteria bacterium]
MDWSLLKNNEVLRISEKVAITSLKGRDHYPVWLLCKALDLSPRTWHDRLSRELAALTPAQIKLNRLSLLVRGGFNDRKGKFGGRRLAHHLHVHKGIKVCRRIMAILKTNNLTCRIRRKACFQ